MNVNPKIIAFVGGRPLFIPFATKSKVFKAPTISATQTPAGIVVTWSNVGADSYALQVSTNGGATFSALTTTANTSFTDTTASFPGSYTYRVQATKGAITSDWSNLATETMVDIPASPGGLTVTGATTSSISLSWNDTADEGSYSIEASVDGLGSWSSAGTTGQNVVTFTHSGLSESVQRYYRVIANNKAGGSIPSSTANSWTVPAAPTGLTATVISTTQIDLSWTDVSTGNQSYKVERSTDNVNWTEIATGLSATATTYSATGLTASTLYYFRVRAANAARNSDYSNTASATTQASTTVPNAPSGFNATSTFADSVSLSWTDNSSGTGQETGFDIEVSTNAGSTYSSVTTTAANATSYSHTGRVESTTYLYRIRATNSAGSSSWVVGDNVTTTAAITGFTATAASSTQINLAWTDKSGVETGFRIERSTDNTNWSLVTTTAANATSFSNTGLNASTLYYYRIRSNSYNGTNDSAWYTASATTQAAGLPSPTYEVNFTTDPYVGTRFSRASRGTFVNSSGFIQVAEQNLVMQSEDLSTTWVRDGLQAFGSGSTVNAEVAPDGSTTADLITETNVNGQHGMYSNGNGLSLTFGTQYTISLYAKKPTSNGRDHVSVGIQAGGHGIVVFNLTNGTYTTNSGWASMTLHSYSIQSVGSGWYRCIVTFSATGTGATGAGSVRIGPSTAAPTNYFGMPSYAGDGVSGVLVWGVQLVQGSSALPYVRTTTSGTIGTPRITHDPVTLAPLGLLMEAQATNLMLFSEEFNNTTGWSQLIGATITTNSTGTVAPDNTNNSDILVEDTTTGTHRVVSVNRTVSTSTIYTASCYVKPLNRNFCAITFYATGGTGRRFCQVFDLTGNGALGTTNSLNSPTDTGGSITAVGNGWYRITAQMGSGTDTSVSVAISASDSASPSFASQAPSFTGNNLGAIYMWGAQLETGTAATSYIPTTTATVTRSGDIYGFFATEVASFWNASAGSVAMNWQRAGREAQTPVAKFGFAVSGNQYMRLNMSGGASPSIANGGSNTVSTVTGHTTTPNIGVPMKSGFSYDSAPNFKGFVNGTAGTNITSVSIPTVNKIEFATQAGDFMQSGYTVAAFGNLVIGRLRYWNTALSDADMQTATT